MWISNKGLPPNRYVLFLYDEDVGHFGTAAAAESAYLAVLREQRRSWEVGCRQAIPPRVPRSDSP